MPLDATTTSARQELSELNREVERATAARDEAQRRYDRLTAPAIELQNTLASLARAKGEYDAEVVAWYENACPGDRPQPPGALLSLEHVVGVLKSDIVASDGALAAAAESLDVANVRLSHLAVRKQSAAHRAAVEAAFVHLKQRFIPAMVESLTELAAVSSIAAVLRGFGINDPEAISAAAEIERAIFEARNSIAVRGNMTAATAYLNSLAQDPMAELPVPQCEVERVKPVVLRPMEDGSVHINRGEPGPPSPAPVWTDLMSIETTG